MFGWIFHQNRFHLEKNFVQQALDSAGESTETARQSCFFAVAEARQISSATVEAEHLLLGLLRGDKKSAVRLGLGPNVLDDIASQIRNTVPSERTTTPQEGMCLAPALKSVFTLAKSQADKEGAQIEPRHLLLGVIQTEGTVASRLLRERGVDFRLLLKEDPD